LQDVKRKPDLNLLLGLDALLRENTVSGAAARLDLSVPAMSHLLGRIRREFDDPILVRSGRQMVPTQRALELKERVRHIVDEAIGLEADQVAFEPGSLKRDFLIVAGEAVLAFLGGPLLAHLAAHSPNVRCAFVSDRPDLLWRNFTVDLAIGVVLDPSPEMRLETLLTDRLVGVCRKGHPLLRSKVTAERYLTAGHLINARAGRFVSPLDARLGGERSVVASAPTVSALWMLRDTDLIGSCYERLEGAAVRAIGLKTFEIPFPLEPVPICQVWHAGHESDHAHTWLRQTIRQVVRETVAGAA
jgi:DNA-binding transcriptional LysR family regulator